MNDTRIIHSDSVTEVCRYRVESGPVRSRVVVLWEERFSVTCMPADGANTVPVVQGV